jgi:beta-ureidopropionase
MNLSRRNFLQKSAITTGMVTIGTLGLTRSSGVWEIEEEKLPREVWISCFSQKGLYTDTAELMVEQVLEALKELEPYHPDFICLPELFPCTHVRKTYTNKEILIISEWTLDRFSAYSKQNNCYTICPVYTSDSDGSIYNSSVVIDRQGKQVGTYRKIHITESEISEGITPGPLYQPVIQTDFGKIGIQICYDINWDDGWTMLKKQGAEIVFWPSAYGAGRMINAKAWQYKYVVASSTQTNDSKICDISGEELARTGFWSP